MDGGRHAGFCSPASLATGLLLAVAATSAQSILQVIESANLTLLAAGIRVSGLEGTLNSTTGANITLFAPTDAVSGPVAVRQAGQRRGTDDEHFKPHTAG